MRRKAKIFDLDGTLVDVRGIRHLIKAQGFDAFHAASATCPPMVPVVRAAQQHKREGYAILILSGRMAKWTNLSSTWLALNKVEYDVLKLRPNRDYRKDFLVKREMWDELQAEYDIDEAYDDNPAIVDLWNHLGLKVNEIPGWQQ